MRTRPGTRALLSGIRKEVLSFLEKVEEFLRLSPPPDVDDDEVVFYFLMPSPSSSDDEEENGLTA